MKLSRYIQRTRALGDVTLAPKVIDTIEAAIEGGETLAALLCRRKAIGVGVRALLVVWRAATANAAHEAYLQAFSAARRKAKASTIPRSLLSQTATRAEVAIMARADALAPPGGSAEHRRRDAIKEALLLWSASLAIVRQEGTLRVEATPDQALPEAFAELPGAEPLGEIAPHRWLAIRRGEKAGALRVILELPHAEIVEQIQARLQPLSAIAGGRSAQAVFEVLLKEDLAEVALSNKDRVACAQAIRSASEAYLGLLAAPRPKVGLVAAIWPAQPIGVAVVDGEGQVLAHGSAEAEPGSLVSAAEGLIGAHAVEAIVLPVRAADPDALQALVRGFEALELLQVRPVAMTPALEHVEGHPESISEAAAKAVVLARRALLPMETWGQLDPVALGLAEYQQDLDESALREALEEMRSLAREGITLADLAPPARDQVAAPRGPARPLNPLVKTVDDLRPGMQINGVVTNIAQFGAFINIGLSTEGLVHVSELADHFVKDPNEVVSVGMQVSARVLGVDRGRGRISLTLKPEPTRRTSATGDGGVLLDDIPGRGRRPQGSGGMPRGGPPTNRSQALADLERLFKKKR